MVRLITIPDLRALIQKVGLETWMRRLIEQLRTDYARWDDFDKSPRHAIHCPQGVIELMPISDDEYYTFKYVNGHPKNPQQKKLNVVAMGVLAEVASGYPLLISEMTLLTAIRTACTSALVSSYLAARPTRTFGIIGTGAQSEFQTLAHHYALGVKEIYYYDIDPKAMEKFAHNLRPYPLHLHPCASARQVAEQSQLITTATAQKGRAEVLQKEWVAPGTHINAIGGDSPGKTELPRSFSAVDKIVVELLQQSRVEGEIQQLGEGHLYAEIWELASGKKPGRITSSEITLFDSVGFALEDYSTLRLLYQIVQECEAGQEIELLPSLADPKNLFSLL